MHLRRNSILMFASVPALALVLAACGGSSSNSSDNSTAAASSAGGADAVATKSFAGVGNVLVDSSGAALYTNDMDTASKIACDGQCLTEWVPLADSGGGQPTSSDSAVQAKLGTMQRPDGSSQVTFGGLPLYTFVDDSPGQATGNGFADSFGGTNFVWTAAMASGKATSSSTTTTGSSSSSSGGSSGYSGGY